MASFDPDQVARFRVALTRINKAVDQAVQVEDMTRTQLTVLSTLARLGPLSATELARLEALNPTMLSRILGKLEARGLATRSPDPDDGRIVRVAATPAGQALHRRLRRERTALFTSRLAEIGPDHAATLLAALPSLEALSESMFGTPAPPGCAPESTGATSRTGATRVRAGAR